MKLSRPLERLTIAMTLAIMAYLFFAPLAWLPAYNELKFPAAAGLLLFLLVLHPLQFVRMDLWWGLFLLTCLLSLTDIKHTPWAWHPLASWVLVIGLMIALRPVLRDYRKAVLWLLQGVFWVTALYMALRMIQYWEMEARVRKSILWPWLIYGKNINVAAMAPLLLLPFVVCVRYKGLVPGLLIRALALAFVAWNIYYFQFSMGWVILAAFIGLGGVMLMPVRLRLLAGLVLLVGATVLVWWQGDPVTAQVKQSAESSGVLRLSYDKLAFAMVTDHPVNGMGLGSWFLSAGGYMPEQSERALNLGALNMRYVRGYANRYKDVLPESVQGLSQTVSFTEFYAYNHNYFTRLMAEIGPIGFLFWIGVPISIFVLLVLTPRRDALPAMASALPLLGWYIGCLTMRMSVSDFIDLSEIQLTGMLGYGLWSAHFMAPRGKVKNEERTNLTPKRRHLHFGSVVVAGLLFLWFSHNFLTNHFQLKALQLAKSEDYCGAIDVLKPWYHPVFRTTINDLEPIARHLARWHDKMEMTDEAAYWYQEAQKCAPDDPGLAYEIEQFRQVAVTR